MKKFQTFKKLFFVLAIVIFILAILPAEHLESLSFWDKSNHFIAFFSLTALFIYAFKYKYSVAFFELLAYGVFIEIAQYFTPNRSSELLDILADSVGILTAIVFIYIFRLFKKIQLQRVKLA